MNAKESFAPDVRAESPVAGPEQKEIWGSDAIEAILRAAQIANTAPRGPTYINLDAALQEAKIGALPPLPDVKRHRAPDPVLPSAHLVDAAAKLLSDAKHPVILAGRVSRGESGW